MENGKKLNRKLSLSKYLQWNPAAAPTLYTPALP